MLSLRPSEPLPIFPQIHLADSTVFLINNGHCYAASRDSEGQLERVQGLPADVPVIALTGVGDYVVALLANGACYEAGYKYQRINWQNKALWESIPKAYWGVRQEPLTPITSADGRKQFTRIEGLPAYVPAVAVTAGKQDVFVLLADGTCYGKGENACGKLGVGDNNYRSQLSQMVGLPSGVPIIAVSTDVYHTAVLLADGTCYVNNNNGQMMLMKGLPQGVPIIAIATGTWDTLVLLADGACYLVSNSARGFCSTHPFQMVGRITGLPERVPVTNIAIVGGDGIKVLLADGTYYRSRGGDPYRHGVAQDTYKLKREEGLPEGIPVIATAVGNTYTATLLANGNYYIRGMNINQGSRRGSPIQNHCIPFELPSEQLSPLQRSAMEGLLKERSDFLSLADLPNGLGNLVAPNFNPPPFLSLRIRAARELYAQRLNSVTPLTCMTQKLSAAEKSSLFLPHLMWCEQHQEFFQPFKRGDQVGLQTLECPLCVYQNSSLRVRSHTSIAKNRCVIL